MITEKQKMLRIAGIVSIIAALLCAVSDLLLRCGPVSGKEITLANMAMIPYSRTMIGALLGATVIPLWLLILFPLYEALKPAGKWFVIPIVILFAHHIAIATLYHGAYAFYSAGYHALAAANGEEKTILLEMIDRFLAFKTALSYIAMISCGLASIYFIITILFRPTGYKKWMVIFTPLIAIPIGLLCKNLPAPIGGYITPPAGTIAYAIFFILTTKVTWKYSESTVHNNRRQIL